MNPSKQQQHEDDTLAWGSEGVYTKHTATPTAPGASAHDHAAPLKHATPLPFAVAVESSIFSQQQQQHPAAPAPARTQQQALHRSKVCWLPILLLFHVSNFALALVAFTLVVTLVPLSVGLLPLCCIGVVVFRVATWTTEWLAQMDVWLANLVRSADSAELRVHPRMGASGSDTSMVARLVFVSPRNLGAMLYFATLKFVVGVLSIVVAWCAVVGPVYAIAGFDCEVLGFKYDDHPVAYVFAVVGTTILGLLLLPAVASLSRKLTQLVCAEDPHAHQCDAAVSGLPV